MVQSGVISHSFLKTIHSFHMAWKESSLLPQSTRPQVLGPAPLSVLTLQPPAPHTGINSVSFTHGVCSHCGAFHLRFPLGWATGALLGGLPGQELLFLLETLDHLLIRWSHSSQVCLWVREALGAPTGNRMMSEAFVLQEYYNKDYAIRVPRLWQLWFTCCLILWDFLPHPQALCNSQNQQINFNTPPIETHSGVIWEIWEETFL